MQYENEHDAYVAGTLGWTGDPVAPTGRFNSVTLTPPERTSRSISEKEAAAVAFYGTPWLLVREDATERGTVHLFATQEARDFAYSRLVSAYSLWSVGIKDNQAVDAIAGYQEAAVFAAGLDQTDHTWSIPAQEQIRADVIAFITANVGDCLAFIEETRHGWLQIGIDFNLTRNREGSGFWDRGAGVVGERLTAAAHAYPEQRVAVGDNGELGVE